VKKRILITAFKYGLGVALLIYVVWRYWRPANGAPGLAELLGRPWHLLPLVLAIVVESTGVLLTFVRWHVLVRAQKLPFTLPDALRLGLVGFFFNAFLPGGVGGDLVKAAFIAKEQNRRTVAVATVLMDRVMGLGGVLLLAAIAGLALWISGDTVLLESRPLQAIVASSVAAVLGALAVWFLLGFLPGWRAERFADRLERRIPKIGPSLAEFWRALWMYRCCGKNIVVATLLTVISQICFTLTFFFSAAVFQEPGATVQQPSLPHLLVMVPIGLGFQALFPTPGGMGGAEAFFSWIYSQVNPVMAATGTLSSFSRRIIDCGLGLIGYLVYLRLRPALPASLEAAIDKAETSLLPGAEVLERAIPRS
jgi:uncharacterized protein (TIRG00374 family)